MKYILIISLISVFGVMLTSATGISDLPAVAKKQIFQQLPAEALSNLRQTNSESRKNIDDHLGADFQNLADVLDQSGMGSSCGPRITKLVVEEYFDTFTENERIIPLDSKSMPFQDMIACFRAFDRFLHDQQPSNNQVFRFHVNIGWDEIADLFTGFPVRLEFWHNLNVHLDLSKRSDKTIEAQAWTLAYYIRRNDAFLKSLNIDENPISDSGFQQIATALRNNEHLESLSANLCGIVGSNVGDLARSLQQNRNLKVLRLGKNKLGDQGVGLIMRGIINKDDQIEGSLDHLDLASNDIGADGIRHIQNALTLGIRLKTLILDGNTMNQEGLEILMDGVDANKNIQDLSLARCNIREGTRHLAEVVCRHGSLKSLNLKGNRIGITNGKTLIEVLADGNSILESLNLQSNMLTDQVLPALGNLLDKHTHLRKLNLRKNILGISNEEFCLKDSLIKNKVLEELDLRDNYFGSGAAPAFGDILRSNTGLRSLLLDRNLFSNYDIRLLASGLAQNHVLKKLSLSNNKIRSAGMRALADALRVNHVLEYLDLSDNVNLSTGGIRALTIALNTKQRRHPSALRVLNLSNTGIGFDAVLALSFFLTDVPSLKFLNVRSNPNIKFYECAILKKFLREQVHRQPFELKFDDIQEKSESPISAMTKGIRMILFN